MMNQPDTITDVRPLSTRGRPLADAADRGIAVSHALSKEVIDDLNAWARERNITRSSLIREILAEAISAKQAGGAA